MTNPFAALGTLFESLAIDHALIGGHAVNVWLEPRLTADVDLTIEADPNQLARLEQALDELGFTLATSIGKDSSGPDFLRFRSSTGSVVLELQAAKTAFQREVIRRAIPTDEGLRVATPEDLIVLKLIASRPRDEIDLLGLCALPSLDWDYVNRWAREWEVVETLRRVRDRVR